MTRIPDSGFGPARTARTCAWSWKNATAYVLREGSMQSMHPSAGHHCGIPSAVLAVLAVLALTVFCGAQRRRPTPVMHRMITADELRFAVLYQQLAHARRGASK